VSRFVRIVLLAAIALFAAAPAASAVPSKKLDGYLAVLWTTVLETPSAQNPYGSGGSAFACFDLGGTVAPIALGGVESCTVKPGTKVFVAASSWECSTVEPPPSFGRNEAELRACARANDAQDAPTVTVDGKSVPVTEVETRPHRPAGGQHLRPAARDARPVRRARLGRAPASPDARDAYDRHRHRQVHHHDDHQREAGALACGADSPALTGSPRSRLHTPQPRRSRPQEEPPH
jgi:hypothetical protein